MAKNLRRVMAVLLAMTLSFGMLGTAVLAEPDSHPHNEVACTECTNGQITCSACSGSGMVGDETTESDSTCSTCGGTGKVNCTSCNGTGEVDCTGTFTAGGTTPATCTEPGSTVYTCTSCNASYEEIIPATGHVVDNSGWTITREPTCTLAGEKAGICSICTQTVIEEIPSLGHMWQTESGVKTCTVCGVKEAALENGVNIIRAGTEGMTYNIGEDQVVMVASPADVSEPIIFTDCTFNLTGTTVKISGNQDGISYNNGEVITKLWIGGNVQFDNCTFVTDATGSKSSSVGYDACIYFFSGDIVLNGCTLSANGYNGQFLGLYGSSGSVTFDNCDISTVNNRNGWSYAMYGGSVLKLVNGSTMTATGMSTDSGNTNAFYSGDNKTKYDAIFVKNSTIDFSDNSAGGFAINNVNIHVDSSTITVSNNKGNACNSGYWIVDGSTITMNGNRGGHALSCIGFEMTDSTVEIMHNGYAGVYVQSRDSSFTNCSVDIRCNGEKLLSYTAGDLWLNTYTLTVDGGTSQALKGSPWLGGVGRKGTVTTAEGTTVVAYDLNTNAADNLKSNTEPTLTSAALALNGEDNGHTLFLNPFMTTPYARGNAEGSASNNDADLFADDKMTAQSDIIGIENAKIDRLTDAQLSHHRYDWANGVVTQAAAGENYGIIRYACLDCGDYMTNTGSHPNSFDCAGTYVYAPAVALSFDANTTDTVENMPETQQVLYNTAGIQPQDPTRSGYTFDGWYTDASCQTAYDFTTVLTENITVYAKWEETSSGGGGGIIYTYYDVTVNYYDEEGNAIAPSHTENIREGLRYDVTAYDAIAIEGYTYVETTGDALTGTVNGNKTINVYYTAETELDDGDTPLDPGPGEDPDIPDGDIPLDPAPGGDEGVDIVDPDTPMGNLPQTGTAEAVTPYMTAGLMALAAAMTMAGLYFSRKRGKHEEL